MHKNLVVFVCALIFESTNICAQNFNEILGRPTNNAVTISVLFDSVVEVYFDYGTTPGALTQQTNLTTSLPQTPVVQELANLQADTRYFYRTVYRPAGTAMFQHGPTRTFHTQRSAGAAFTFLIEADEHLYDKKGIRELYEICLANQALDTADFLISLGDTFGDDHTPLETSSADMQDLHLDYRQYLGQVCHSMPFFFCLGNHEGESGYWLDQTPPENIAVYGTNWRKFYYPNPFPNGFYSGNTTQEPYGIGYPENYYAFLWGDALFVVLDVYRSCDAEEQPKKWDWTLGDSQYQWLKNTLENSTAAHKFVFAHHNRGLGRGGILPARGYEWGGYGNNGNGDWEFDQMRPGWAMPIHQLMANYGVNIFFQGHDHLYARETLDGVVYQEVPMPSDTSYQIGMLANADAYTDLVLDGSGHLRVSVTSDCITVDYVAAYLPQDTLGLHKNREIRYQYHLGNCITTTTNAVPESSQKALKVFPNPTKGHLTIQVPEPATADRQVHLTDTRGQLVKTCLLPAFQENISLDMPDLPAGWLFVRVDGNTARVFIQP